MNFVQKLEEQINTNLLCSKKKKLPLNYLSTLTAQLSSGEILTENRGPQQKALSRAKPTNAKAPPTSPITLQEKPNSPISGNATLR